MATAILDLKYWWFWNLNPKINNKRKIYSSLYHNKCRLAKLHNPNPPEHRTYILRVTFPGGKEISKTTIPNPHKSWIKNIRYKCTNWLIIQYHIGILGVGANSLRYSSTVLQYMSKSPSSIRCLSATTSCGCTRRWGWWRWPCRWGTSWPGSISKWWTLVYEQTIQQCIVDVLPYMTS